MHDPVIASYSVGVVTLNVMKDSDETAAGETVSLTWVEIATEVFDKDKDHWPAYVDRVLQDTNAALRLYTAWALQGTTS